METRTIYVPANHFGRNVLGYVWEHVACSMGDIKRVEDALRVPITLPSREVIKLEKILQNFNLM